MVQFSGRFKSAIYTLR